MGSGILKVCFEIGVNAKKRVFKSCLVRMGYVRRMREGGIMRRFQKEEMRWLDRSPYRKPSKLLLEVPNSKSHILTQIKLALGYINFRCTPSKHEA